jgi:hypothetical protein
MDLAKVGGAPAITALAQALADADYAVRMLAWDGLIAVLDLDRKIRNPAGKRDKTTRLELLNDFLACDLAAFVRIGVDEMRAITDQLVAGGDPAALDLIWRPDPAPDVRDRITQAMLDPDAAYPVDAIAQLTGVPRYWAEAAVAMGLDQATPDPRVPDALVQLAAHWTVPALDEVARSSARSPALAAAVAQALTALRAS